jgi:ubiquitin thioesterase protein OTUB1
MISTKGQGLGLLEPLASLEEQFSEANTRAKLQELARTSEHYRRSRGDGNCFYRAAGFAFLERLLLTQDARLGPFLQRMQAVRIPEAVHKAQELQEQLSIVLHAARRGDLQNVYEILLSSTVADHAFIWGIRLLCAEYCREAVAKEMCLNGLPLDVAIEATHGVSVEAYCEGELLAFGSEAESMTLHILALCLGAHVRTVQIDRSAGPAPTSDFPDEALNGAEPDVFLLFKPGHYDILYGDATVRAFALKKQEDFGLERSCLVPIKCLICMDDEDLTFLCGRPPCGCIICDDCMSRATDTKCMVCKEDLTDFLARLQAASTPGSERLGGPAAFVPASTYPDLDPPHLVQRVPQEDPFPQAL